MKKQHLILCILALFVSTVTLPAQTESPYAAWVKFSPAKLGTEDWTLKITDAGAERERLDLVGTRENKRLKDSKILFLIDSQQGWSDTSIFRILTVFAERNFFPAVSIYNYKKDKTALPGLLSWAERQDYKLIITFGSTVLSETHKVYLNGKLPVITAVNKDPVLLGYIADYESASGTNFAYTSVNTPIDVQTILLKQLKPTVKNVAILVDRSNASAMKTQYEPVKAAFMAQGINVVDIVVGPSDDKDPDLLQKVKDDLLIQVPEARKAMLTTDPDGDKSVFWLTFCTSIVKNMETLNTVTGSVPVIGVATDTVMEGDNSAVIGMGVSFDSNAYVTAIYAMNVLEGKAKIGELKVGLAFPPDIAINFHKAQAIQLKIPFKFFESATVIYGPDGKRVR